MSESSQNLLSKLIVISKVDASLARINAEHSQLETELADRILAAKALRSDYEARKAELDKQRSGYDREEKRLRDEQQKLVDRRKGLLSFTDYKVAQAAQKEIEHASKQLGLHEEKLLATLDQIDSMASEVNEIEETLSKMEGDLNTFEEEARGTMETLLGRRDEREQERKELAQGIESRPLTLYEGSLRRFPTDPVVAIGKDYLCQGCFMQVGPQMLLRISRGEELIKCPGCGRILFIDESSEEE